MHWRTPFPPKRPSVLAELIDVARSALHPEKVLPNAPDVPREDGLPPARVVVRQAPALRPRN